MNKIKPFFSIVIPTLNEERYLPNLLDCLLGQHFTDFEVILIDGGSHDKTRTIAEQFQKKFSLHGQHVEFVHSPGKNVPFQRNLGAGKGKGAYFVFFDADVAVGPAFLAKIHKHIDLSHNQLITTWCTPDYPSTINRILAFIMNWSVKITRKSKKPLLMGFNIIMSREAFKKTGGFDDTLVLGEDHALAQAAVKNGISVSFLHDPKLIFSVRRFSSEGHLVVIKKYIWSTLYIWLKGPIKHQIYEYKMGGQNT